MSFFNPTKIFIGFSSSTLYVFYGTVFVSTCQHNFLGSRLLVSLLVSAKEMTFAGSISVLLQNTNFSKKSDEAEDANKMHKLKKDACAEDLLCIVYGK